MPHMKSEFTPNVIVPMLFRLDDFGNQSGRPLRAFDPLRFEIENGFVIIIHRNALKFLFDRIAFWWSLQAQGNQPLKCPPSTKSPFWKVHVWAIKPASESDGCGLWPPNL